jgi:hypothetical protein
VGQFELLVFRDQAEIRPRHLSAEDVEKRIALERQFSGENIKIPAANKRIVRWPVIFQVYAALGEPSNGANLSDIRSRTALPRATLEACLKLLVSEKVIEAVGERYYARNLRCDFLNLTKNEGLVDMTKQVSSDINQNTHRLVEQPNNSVLYSAFSVKRERMPQFKAELLEVIFELIDRYQEEPGDTVRQLFISSMGAKTE